MTIGERIKLRRLEIGLSVDQVAEKIGKNRATIYRYESNDIEKFPLDILDPLAEVLRTTPAYLMGWEESKTEGTLPDYAENRNVVRIAGRNGSYQERHLTDQQLAALVAILDQMPDVPDDL